MKLSDMTFCGDCGEKFLEGTAVHRCKKKGQLVYAMKESLETDNAIEIIRERAQLSEGWIPTTNEERRLMKLAEELAEIALSKIKKVQVKP